MTGTWTRRRSIDLAGQVWPGDYDGAMTRAALSRTINLTAWDGERLAGCLRILTDGCFFGTITELLVQSGVPAAGDRQPSSPDGAGPGTDAAVLRCPARGGGVLREKRLSEEPAGI